MFFALKKLKATYKKYILTAQPLLLQTYPSCQIHF